MIEYVRQCDENQVRSSGGADAVAEAGREDNQSRHQRDNRVKNRDDDSFARKALFFSDIAAENGQCADTEAQREEGLSHSGIDDGYRAVLHEAVKVRQQIIGKSFAAAGQQDRVAGQQDHQHEQRAHDPFARLLDALFQTEVADAAADDDRRHHVADHGRRVGQEGAEDTADGFRRKSVKAACQCLVEIIRHPARDRRIEHHQQEIPG